MKELSIEEKAKRYDEALERAKTIFKCYKIYNIKDALESIFPEVKESEDERIRKALIDFFIRDAENGEQTNGVWNKDILAWLEKQSKKEYALKSSKDEDVHKFMQYIEEEAKAYEINLPNRSYDIYAFAKDILVRLENQGYQNPADKSEPKFKVGDWVVLSTTSGGENIVQIDSIKYFKSGEPMYITSEGRWFGNGTKAYLWTIQDAKDGDVLATDKSVFIYAKVLYSKPYAYCGVDKFGVFKNNCLKNNWANSVDNIHPATKEQRDILFQKMKEAGCELDFTKRCQY